MFEAQRNTPNVKRYSKAVAGHAVQCANALIAPYIEVRVTAFAAL